VAASPPTLLGWVMLAQSLLGLSLPDQYRDVEWIKATWYANDWVTLLVATPLLWYGHARAARGSVPGLLLWLGTAAYAVYNYAFYLFGAALNPFFPLYVLGVVLGAAALGWGIAGTDVDAVAASFGQGTPARMIGGYLVTVAAGLAIVWLGLWGAHVFGGRPTPVEPEAFKVVAALDLSLLVPSLGLAGMLLWRKEPWGYLAGALAAVMGSLYLLVLALGSAVAIARGLATAPGELPIWGTLTVLTTAAVVALLLSTSLPGAPPTSSRPGAPPPRRS
jgi:hypothetical protein